MRNEKCKWKRFLPSRAFLGLLVEQRAWGVTLPNLKPLRQRSSKLRVDTKHRVNAV